jgi:hypothetical protein
VFAADSPNCCFVLFALLFNWNLNLEAPLLILLGSLNKLQVYPFDESIAGQPEAGSEDVCSCAG